MPLMMPIGVILAIICLVSCFVSVLFLRDAFGMPSGFLRDGHLSELRCKDIKNEGIYLCVSILSVRYEDLFFNVTNISDN